MNDLPVRSEFVRPIPVGPDRGWATNLATALQSISEPYILYFQDDYFLKGPVRDEQLAGDFAYAMEHDAASFCFYARSQTEPGFEPLNDRFGLVPRNSDGRTRLQVTLWKKEVLQTILRPGESAWDMEARGSDRTRDLLCLSYLQRREAPIPYLMSAIVRSLWTPEALALCQEGGVKIMPNYRSHHSDVPWRRRFRRGVDRVRLLIALAQQRGHMIDLDTSA